MIKKLINDLKSQRIKDSYFGEMGFVHDKLENCYYLDKDIELESIHTPVILYVKSDNKRSNRNQQKAFEEIKENFPTIWINVKSFLTKEKKIITEGQFKKEYRLESITIPIDIKADKIVWELDLLNLKDGFSRIIIEVSDLKPFQFSVEA